MYVRTLRCREEQANGLVSLLPTIAIKREDVFDDEAVHYVILHWLIFQVYVKIITEKL